MESTGQRPVLYQICRAGDRFEVGDGPFDLSRLKVLVLGRGAEGGYDAKPNEDVIRVADPWMSGRHAAILREADGFKIKDLGSTNGVLVNGRKMEQTPLTSGDLLETGRTFWVFVELTTEPNPPLEPTVFGQMSSWNPVLSQQLGLLARASRGGQHILLKGEPGVGKEYCAHAIHDVSLRAGRLVIVDCARTSPEQMHVELFGSQDARAGAVALSSSGSLYLHCVEKLPLEVQSALTTTLTEKRVVPRAGGKPLNVDVRVIASTEVELNQAVRRAKFDAALYTELTQFVMTLPSVRDRREDLGLLIDSLLTRAGGSHAITRDACRALLNHPWPRNVRELAKIIEGGALLAGDERPIDLMHLPGVIAEHAALDENVLAEPVGEDEVALAQAPDDDAKAAFEDFADNLVTDPDSEIPSSVRERVKKRVAAEPPPPPPPPPPKIVRAKKK